MITTAPLPTLRQLFAVLAAGGDPATSWRGKRDSLVLSRSAWGLAALTMAVSATAGRPARILLPAWFCNQSLEPLRTTGAHLDFVPVESDGTARWPDAAAADLVIVVHTFGRAAPCASARALCQRSGAVLVEDCAHCLGPAPGIGDQGDAALFSPHKLLGLPEGAVLAGRSDLVARARAALGRLPSAPVPVHWLARRLAQYVFPDRFRSITPRGGPPDFLLDPPCQPPPPAMTPSLLAMRLMAAADLDAEAAERRHNARQLARVMESLGGWRTLVGSEAAAPYRLALLCDDSNVAVERYRRLRDRALPVESWPDPAPEVTAAPHRFGAAMELRHRVLLLPVHSALPRGYERLYAEALDAC